MIAAHWPRHMHQRSTAVVRSTNAISSTTTDRASLSTESCTESDSASNGALLSFLSVLEVEIREWPQVEPIDTQYTPPHRRHLSEI